MEVTMLNAAGEALSILMDPFRLAMLAAGTLMGLVLGIIPGIGGLAGMALLLPFTFTMDPYAAFAMLLGMTAVTNTSDTIPAVLFGVPGSASAQATVLDGAPMTKRGEAGRALSAAYTASLIGGLFGAAVLAFAIPLLRPVILMIGAPEFCALSIFGLAMVAVLSGSAPIRGLIAAGLGVMLSMVGSEPQTGTMRWTMGNLYLWDGVPIVPIVLGLFALPELADLAIKRQSITSESKFNVRAGMWTGFVDTIRNWWLVLRCSSIGAAIGALPGVSPSVVDWLAYGHAVQTVKGAGKTFGKGDVRGLIAPESANNSTTAGSLVPTIALGIPGSATMAILLSVFLVHGLVPGPAMLTKDLTVTYSMVWSIAIANIIGAGICFLFSGQLAKIALLRYTLILPSVMTFVYIGTFQASRSWGDFYLLIVAALLGWTMKQIRWPRPPLILGLVLGDLLERNLFISFTRYGYDWLTHPVVIVILIMAVLMIGGPIRQHWKIQGGFRGIARNMSRPQFHPQDLMYVVMILLVGWMVLEAAGWRWAAKVAPLSAGLFVLAMCAIGLLNQVFSRAATARRIAEAAGGEGSVDSVYEMHMDSTADHGDMTMRTMLLRAGIFLGYLLLFMASMAIIGFLPTVPLFVAFFMRVEGRENWRIVTAQAVLLTIFMYLVFDRLLHLPWPPTLLGEWLPAMKIIPSV